MIKAAFINNKYIIKLITIILLAWVSTNTCFAQIDSAYISPFEQRFSVQASVSSKFLSLIQRYDNKEMRDFTLTPNTPINIGLGFSYKNLSISGSYGFQFLRDKDKAKTESFDFQYHYYARKYVLDIFFQKYKGYNTEYEDEEEVYTSAADVKLSQYGIHGMYIFNNRKFSYKAAYNLSEKQIKSAGGLLLGGGIYQSQIRSDSTLILRDNKNKQDNFQLGVSAGYGYTWVIKKDFFVAASMTLGINIGADRIDKLMTQKLDVYPSVFPRFSAGYHGKDWSIGFSTLINNISVDRLGESSTTLNSGTFQLTFVKRFDTHPKILNKLPSNIVK